MQTGAAANLSCSLKFQPTNEWMVFYLCRLEEQVLQLLRAKIRSLELNNSTPIYDSNVARVIRAATYWTLSIVDCCGTNLSISQMMFQQVVLLLEISQRYTTAPISKFILSSTGLNEPLSRTFVE
jgi:hypothetical protein